VDAQYEEEEEEMENMHKVLVYFTVSFFSLDLASKHKKTNRF